MKHLNVLAILALLPVAVFAANNFDDEVNAELDKMYGTSAKPTGNTNQASPSAVQVNVNTGASSQARTNATQVTEAVTQVQPQKQPTTLIEASPLTESRADKIRKARQEVEVQTEQKIVEKLEVSRIEDEKRRSEVLFGDRFNALSGANQAPVAAVAVAPAPAPVAAPAPPVVIVAPVPPPPVVESAPIKEILVASKVIEEIKTRDQYQMGLLFGLTEYNAKNVKGNYSLGFAGGKVFDDHFALEGSFIYSNFQVEQIFGGGTYYGQYYPRITEMSQYQTGVTAKYLFFSGVFRPLVGATMAYSYRTYTDTQFGMYNSDATSNALDVGAILGIDLDVSKSFTFGFEARYMTNMTSTTSSNFQTSFMVPNQVQTPIEKVNYMTLGIVGRTTF